MANPVLVEVTRGDLVESRHRGAIAIADAKGGLRMAIGDVERPVFPRSAVKLIQSLSLIESGAADAFGYGVPELALACASHSSEPRHVELVTAMLEKCGRSAADLECGVQLPLDGTAAQALIRSGELPGAVHNTCSGEHAGFVCLSCHLGVDPKGYVEPEHRVQKEVTSVLEAMTGTPLTADIRGIDGCSIPTYAIPLVRLAEAFARLVTGEGLSPRRAAAANSLFDACMAEPMLVAGTGRFCTDAMLAFSGRLFVKYGAEGVYCGAIPELGLGIAIKCSDGATPAAEVMMASVVAALLQMGDDEREMFSERMKPKVKNRNGKKVGEFRPVAGLIESIRRGRAI